jgi:hypothetical protein
MILLELKLVEDPSRRLFLQEEFYRGGAVYVVL